MSSVNYAVPQSDQPYNKFLFFSYDYMLFLSNRTEKPSALWLKAIIITAQVALNE